VLLPVTQQSRQDSSPALTGGLQQEALPSFKIRRLARGQSDDEATHLGGLFQFTRSFFLHRLGHH